MTHLNEIAAAAYKNSAAHGFWDDAPEYEILLPQYLAAKIALIHSEASEALEELRKKTVLTQVFLTPEGKPEGFASELADIIIRVADLAGYLGIDLDNVVADKMAYNATRKMRHGKAF